MRVVVAGRRRSRLRCRSKGVRSIDNEQILLDALTKLVGEESFYVGRSALHCVRMLMRC